MKTHNPLSRLAFGPGALVGSGSRMLPEEVAVALSFNGSTQAVMMATPADLEDFAYGFALTEGLAKPDEILSVEVVDTPKGIDVDADGKRVGYNNMIYGEGEIERIARVAGE